MNRNIKYIIIVATMLAGCLFFSCEDEIDYDGGPVEEGVSTIDVELGFKGFCPALDARSSGTAIKHIKTLWLFFYNRDGKFIRKQQITNFTEKLEDNTRPDGKPSSESQTGHASFKLTLDNGYYKIYAVANNDFSTVADKDVDTPQKLKDLHIQWQENYQDTPEFNSPNSQMFGWFVNGSKTTDHGTDASVVIVRNDNSSLHAWLTRAASKVTISFNTIKLSDDVRLYIKSVQIKDIPKYCHLGSENAPGDDNNIFAGLSKEEGDKLIHDGEMILFGDAKSDDTGKENHKSWKRIHSGDSVFGLYSDRHGMPPRGTSPQDRWMREHQESAPALYFFENMQGEGIINTISDKRQDVNGNNSQISFPDGVNPDNEAWKDAKPYGSYIEVQGYYENNGTTRPGKGDIIYRFMLGKDHITDYNAERNHHYRLSMIFNGQANDIDFHIDYREEAKPGLFVQDTTYVSYLYNQQCHTNVRATPRPGYVLESIRYYIVENEWRPYSATQKDGDFNDDGSFNEIRKQAVDDASLKSLYNYEAWTWQKDFFGSYKRTASSYLRPEISYSWTDFHGNTHSGKSAKNIEFGYLSLRKTSKKQYDFDGYGDKGLLVDNLRKLFFLGDINGSGDWTQKSRGYRKITQIPTSEGTHTFGDDTDGIGHITYKKNIRDNIIDYVVEVPLYTRAMSIDSWAVYSGTNSFYRHFRYARVVFIAKYKKSGTGTDAKDPETYEEFGQTHVLQARRIDNPRGIYRSRKNSDPFYVVLCYNAKTAQQQLQENIDENEVIFQPVISNGPWTAIIENDPHNLVRISTNGQTATGTGGQISGRNNTPIQFTYTPNSEPVVGDSYGASIFVKYHNNSCTHRIIVRRGYDAVSLDGDDSSPKFSSFNVYDSGNLTKSPLSIGSTFRRSSDCYSWPIAESNNFRPGFGVHQTPVDSFDIIGKTVQYSWADIPAATSGNTYPAPKSFYNSFHDKTYNYRLPDKKDLPKIGIYTDKDPDSDQQKLEAPIVEQYGQAFGICYADGATRTLFTKGAYTYSDPENKGGTSEKGVRGVIVYHSLTGRNIFFPFGSFAQPRRRENGYLQYGSVGRLLTGGANNYRPMAYSLMYQSGGCFWISTANDSHVAIDFNGGSYMSSYLNVGDVFQSDSRTKADALPIKPVRTN